MFRANNKDIQDQVAKLNTSDCIKKPDTSNAIIIYSCIPQKYYDDVLTHGLKSYDLLTKESKEARYHALPGHNQCVFFRPGFYVSDDLLKREPYIGIKVDPHKVKIANQEIRTLTGASLNSMYLVSAVSYDQFHLEREKYLKELPIKFPHSDKSGQLIWLTYMDAVKKNYLPYVPEIAINLSEPIPPEMFAYCNKSLSREKSTTLLLQTNSTIFSSKSDAKLDKVSIEEVRHKLSDKILGLKSISSDSVGYIRLIFEDKDALNRQLKIWSHIGGLKQAIYPDNCIEIDNACTSDIVDKMLQVMPRRLSDSI